MDSIVFKRNDYEEVWEDFLYAKYSSLIMQYPGYSVYYPPLLFDEPPEDWDVCKLSIAVEINSQRKTIVLRTDLVSV